MPEDGSLAPRIENPQRRINLWDDEPVERWQIVSIDIASGEVQPADHPGCDVNYPYYNGFFNAGRGWWDADSRYAYFIDQRVDKTETQLIKLDTRTGHCQSLLREDPGRFTIIPTMHVNVLAKPLPESNELIWYSDRSGWPHFYLYELSTGTLKHPLTSGEWVARSLLHIDTERRELIIQIAGHHPGRNPYYQAVYKVAMDSGELTPLLDSDHEITVQDPDTFAFWGAAHSGVSPSGRYLVITRSRVDQPPVSLLLDRQGNTLMSLEEAELSGLPSPWQWPEPVRALAADGETEIYGTLFKPSDFSPDRHYPVLDLNFEFFAEPAGAFSNNAGGSLHYLTAMAYAELGFIVLKLNNRGGDVLHGAGLRNKAFNDFRDMSVPRENKADCVAAIQHLASTRPYMDLERVGVCGWISSPVALSGLLIHPEFYRVGVDINPSADDRVQARAPMGGETGFPPFEQFADNLRGKLLLIHGMLDPVVPVSATLRVVEALKNANKRFDMLLLPNGRHDNDPYAIVRSWDYLVEHLLGQAPPDNAALDFTTSDTSEISHD